MHHVIPIIGLKFCSWWTPCVWGQLWIGSLFICFHFVVDFLAIVNIFGLPWCYFNKLSQRFRWVWGEWGQPYCLRFHWWDLTVRMRESWEKESARSPVGVLSHIFVRWVARGVIPAVFGWQRPPVAVPTLLRWDWYPVRVHMVQLDGIWLG